MIAIIDYGAGNLRSVQKAVEFLGKSAQITRDKDQILAADHLILPGVGAFADAAEKLKKGNLFRTIYDAVDRQIPLLGICLGFQLLFESSEEGNGAKGLGLIKGRVLRLPEVGLKIPQMGWNDLSVKANAPLLQGVPDHSYVYFVHSYYAEAADKGDVTATTEYGRTLDVAVQKGCVCGTQFHPEKSSAVGLKILKNFICG